MPISRLLPLAALTLLLTLLCIPTQAQQSLDQKKVTVAVMPFEVNAGDDLAYLKDSLPELLADRLQDAGLGVITVDDVMKVVEQQGIQTLDADSAREVALLLGAGYALYGSFNQLGENLSIDARLIDAFGLTPSVPISVTRQGLINLLPAADELVTQVTKNVLGEKTIAEIDVEGTKVLDKEVVLMRLSVRKGDDYSPRVINDDLKTIFDLGYFDDVKVVVSDVPGGKKVLFQVDEKPRIQALSVEGADDVDPDTILEVISTKEGSILNPNVLKDDLNIIRVLYRKEGHYKSKVDYRVEGGETGQARLIFTVEEGPVLYIEDIIFDGAEQVDPDDLEGLISLSETDFFSWFTDSGVLNEESLERDSAAITAYYHNNGFIEATVSRPEVDIRDDGIYVTFRISEGPRYKINDIGFLGDIIAPEEELFEYIGLDEYKEDEEYYSTDQVRLDGERLTRFYNDKGFAYAEITPLIHNYPDNQTVDIDFEITKHQRVHIRRILVVGNDKTRDNIILREMMLADGDQFAGTYLEQSQARLEQLGYFEVVGIEPVPTGDPDEMDLKVTVKEKATGRLSGGVGYTSYGGAYLSGSVAETNLFGKGYSLTFDGAFGSSSTSFNLDFVNPHVNDTSWAFGMSAFNTRQSYNYYDKSSLGGTVRVAHPLGNYSVWRVTYGLTRYDIYDVDSDAAEDIQDDEGVHLQSFVLLNIIRTTVKNKGVMPVSGTSQSIGVTYSGGVLGGDDAFVKYVAGSEWYMTLFSDVIFHAKVSAGYVHENSNEDIPTGQRFYLGGINSVRGYTNYMISPRDYDTEDAIGGNKMAYTQLEMYTPLFTSMGLIGVVFFDAGGAWNEGDMFFSSTEENMPAGYDMPALGLYKSVGAGLRWMSPMGPLRFEYGYGLDELEGSKNHKIEFSMGSMF